MERLVLWDIDHTLISTRGVGRELSALAFAQVTGIAMREQASVEGITEPVIFRETAALHGVATDRGDFERFAVALAQAHRDHSTQLRERGHALPGAAAALDRMAAAEPGIRQSVVSGNIRAVAGIKLEVFGLDTHIDWAAGAYGDDAEVRSALVSLALARAGGVSPVPAERAVVIGDTPADVEAARANRVPVIAVASGRSSVQQLRAAGAERVLLDLRDTDLLLRLVHRSS
ncbi:HAD family hydrolase [Streptomyces sp. NPDC048644]|uniref:HAD family hydrolase n=1 Tax=Streptomyces sp. NPDC048644 TaxID=3365582 RepID=UPI00371E369D